VQRGNKMNRSSERYLDVIKNFKTQPLSEEQVLMHKIMLTRGKCSLRNREQWKKRERDRAKTESQHFSIPWQATS